MGILQKKIKLKNILNKLPKSFLHNMNNSFSTFRYFYKAYEILLLYFLYHTYENYGVKSSVFDICKAKKHP